MNSSRLLLSACATALALGMAAPAFAGDITGQVFDATNTIALQSAQVRIVELDRAVTTARDGTYVIAGLPAGTYTLEARYVGAETVTRSVTVSETGATIVDVALGSSTSEILVIGQAANLASALSRKRESDTVGDVLSRDAIGQFPDQNVAESLRRLPGVNVLNDQGEGRFVSVRGLDPELNATSLNGVRVPSPGTDVRSVALDVISSDIIESIEVKKSLTPDMDADTIGASIEIETTSAFARKSDLYTVKIEGSYNDYAEHVSPKGSFDFSTRLSDNFGVTGGISYYKRKFETDNVEADGWNAGNDADIIFAEDLEYRDYDVTRQRISGTLGFDLRASDTTELYLKGIYSEFNDLEYRRRTVFDFGDFDDDGPSGGSATTALFDDDDQEFTVERDIKDRREIQRIRSVVFGGKTEANDWKASYSASWSKSTEVKEGAFDPVKFARDFDGDGLQVLVDYSNPKIPSYSIPNAPADFLDASTYELDDVELTVRTGAEDTEYAAKFDLAREFYTAGGTFTVQGGVKSRWREKIYDAEVGFYENGDMTLADALGAQTYRLADMGPVASYTGASDYFRDNFADFELQEVDSQFDSAVGDYAIKEDILAGYLLGRWDSSKLRVIGGVRYERTSNELRGNNVLLVEEDGTLPDDTIATEDTVIVAPVMIDRSYEHWLPSLNLRWEAQDDLVVRLAGYKSLVRPKLSKLAPRFLVEQNDDDEREGEFGNPDLKPYEAWNFDASLEYYLSGNGALSAAFFYKDVKNFIVDVNLEDPGVYRGIAYDEAVVPINGESGEIYGFELSYAQAFTMLPAPFDGLLVQANYTYTDAKGLVPNDGDPTDLRQINLPASAKNTVNLVLGYEKGPLSLRLSGTYRDKYLDELGSEADEDRIVDNHFQLDLSAKYDVTKNVQLFYEWVNLNNATYYAFNNVGGRRNLLQYEEYNWTMKFGAKVNF